MPQSDLMLRPELYVALQVLADRLMNEGLEPARACRIIDTLTKSK